MKTICSLAVICVIALAQTSLDATVIPPNERPEFRKWILAEELVRLLGADESFELIECVIETIDQYAILSDSEESILNHILNKIRECIESADMR